ncbi:polyprenyl synthetase family protein [Bacillus sp. CMF21]|uniref:polyprenyl synthetase family protein n=1 Tax=Metabacillus dongyingensis TaxID=2874282 RepID=UPI001CBFB685|nr:farnesyl diphosphate synthase [Metabacillus dongyingensis]UAL50976.1 polyprenyl synthetase family protein [Metabacillus dongyingensis]USK27252.1 polyprenyl synthetase family protein [Bacillus sp. CMF21]
MTLSLDNFLSSRKELIEGKLPLYVSGLKGPASIKEAMIYSLSAGGKRIRPALVLAVLNAFGKREEIGIPAACAVEMIHTYSLIHDDLPSMDDDDLRRGKPTNHKVYGEALAILSGDGLLTHSFGLIADQQDISAEKRLALISELVKASGIEGMVGGQVADMQGEAKNLQLSELEYIHEHKTAKLLAFSIIAGAILAEASNDEIAKLREFAYHIGIAFQIQDDILDIEGQQSKIGKPVGSDETNKKTTYPSLLTLPGAKQKLEDHISHAKAILANINIQSGLLEELCDLIASRDH